MTELTIEALGFTKEELEDRVVQRIVDTLLHDQGLDEDGDAIVECSPFHTKLRDRVRDQIDARVKELADAHILPKVETYIDTLTLQERTRWGEARGTPMSFLEYLTNRAESYLTEQVNFEGKDKASAGGYSWTGTQTRLTAMVNQHLHYTISSAMKEAVSRLNTAIVPALEATVKLKLKELSESLAVAVTVKK